MLDLTEIRPGWHRHPNGGGWVQDTAYVAATAYVGPDAQVSDNAWVYGDARVCDNAWVYGNAQVYGDARVYGNARVYGDAWVWCNARVFDNAWVYGDARVCGNARVWGNARVSRSPKVLTGFPYIVTITDHHVAAGCKMHPPSVWRKRGAAIIRADGYRDKATDWAAIINAIADAHGCVDAPIEGAL